jgi:hypothetical protein
MARPNTNYFMDQYDAAVDEIVAVVTPICLARLEL